MAKLIQRVKVAVGSNVECYAWSDSTITLARIKNGDNKDKFIRCQTDEVRKIKEIKWGHVRTEDNPADLASRGISADKLKDFKIWWKGPQWLAKSKEHWPKEEIEEKLVVGTTMVQN